MAEPKQINPVEMNSQDALSSIEEEWLKQWRDKRAKESIGFSYEIREAVVFRNNKRGQD